MNLSSIFSPSSVRHNPDVISRRAYEIWNREGCPDGCDLRHWLQAEQELSIENPHGGGADPAGDVSGNGNGNGNDTGYGNGRAEESPARTASARTSSIAEGETPSVPAVEKTKRSSTADTLGKTAARGSASKRKSSGSGRGPAL